MEYKPHEIIRILKKIMDQVVMMDIDQKSMSKVNEIIWKEINQIQDDFDKTLEKYEEVEL